MGLLFHFIDSNVAVSRKAKKNGKPRLQGLP